MGSSSMRTRAASSPISSARPRIAHTYLPELRYLRDDRPRPSTDVCCFAMGTRAFHAGSNRLHSDGAGDTAHEVPTPWHDEVDTPRSSSGQDGGLSRRKPEFDSPSGHTAKRCTMCAETKPLDAFNRKTRARDGRQSYCRDCGKTLYKNPQHRAKALERSRRQQADRLDQKRAHRKLNWAIESGKMTRGFCECCGSEKTDAHHWRGYDHPLDVQWLCRSCHVRLEPRRGRAA